jgi:TetR/AcrR family transcriptional regulator
LPKRPSPVARRSQETRSAASRHRLLTAGAAEFAARGFAGANVERIAQAARVNKAMIYYHFRSKAALYREILRDMFEAVAVRVSAAEASTADPADKIRAFVDAIATEAEARPHFPPIWFREIAEGGAHLDEGTLTHVTGIVKTLGRIMHEGHARGQFDRINPVLIHAGIVAPLLLYFASGRLRRRLGQAGVPGIAGMSRDAVVAHVQRITVMALEGHTA